MKKPGLIMLPGMHGTSALFKPFIDKAKPYLSLSCYDYPQEGSQDYEHLAENVGEFIGSVPGKQWLLGESFSGPIALMMALKMPQKFHGVILSGTFSHNPSPILKLVPNAWVAEFILRTGKPLAPYFSLGLHSGSELETLFSQTLDKVPPHILAARLMAVKNIDLEDQLATITLPVLSLVAKYDKMVGHSGGHSLKKLSNHKEIEIDSNHLILQEKPNEALQAILQFTANQPPSNLFS